MRLAKVLQRWRTTATGLVPLVLLVAVWLAPGPRPRLIFLLAGTAVVVLGEAIRVWASGYRQRQAGLVTTGPFGYTRNPLYLGSTAMGAGFCLMSHFWWSWLLLVGALAVFYLPTVGEEERSLAKNYAEDYARYRTQVPRFGLRLRPYRPEGGGDLGFSWRSVLERDEHWTALWTALAVAGFWLRLLVGHGLEGLL